MELNLLVQVTAGGEEAYPKALHDGDETTWHRHWLGLVARLKMAVGLGAGCELSAAIAAYGSVQLSRGPQPRISTSS